MSEIHDLRITPLRRIPDERGAVMHMLRADDPAFERFGEIYFSLVYPGVVKGWHLPPPDDAQLRGSGGDGQARLLRRSRRTRPPRGACRSSISASSTTRW